MAAPLLTLRNISLGFGGDPLFASVELQIAAHDRICLVGRNGTGKSTLLKIIAGLLEPDGGERTVRPGLGIAYMAQEAEFAGAETVADAVAAGLPEDAAESQHRVLEILQRLDLDGAAAPGSLSGGEARRLALARTLISEPDILLLDEPTNHLDLPTIEWLESELGRFPGALVLISHDRAFLNRLTRQTFWLEGGVVRRLDQGFMAFDDWSERILEQEAEQFAKLKGRIVEEERWLHRGVTARRRRNQGRLRRLEALREQRARRQPILRQSKLNAERGEISGRLVIEATAVAKSYGGRVVVHDFTTRIMRGDRVGIIGANGTGKTTLLRLLIGELAPDSGDVRLGSNLRPAYLDQMRAQLDSERTLWDTLCEGGGDHVSVGGRSRHVVGYLRDFLFEERQARSPVSSLSGGERNRLLLAKTLARPANLLVLDEPTNDLDMETLDLLQEMMADYEGTVLLVSHDRDFLDRVVTSTIVLEGDGRAAEYPGGYSDYLRQRPASGDDARAKPTRKKGASKPTVAGKRQKLSYHQQRELTLLPDRIATLQQEIGVLEARLADPALFAQDAGAFADVAKALEARRGELSAAEDRWLEIEMLREEIEAERLP